MAAFAAAQLAYLLPSGEEMIVILVIGVLLFGRRLPEVGRQVGRVVAEFRRGLDGFKAELTKDESFRDLRSGFRDIQRATDIPRKVADPRRLFADLTDPSRSSGTISPQVPVAGATNVPVGPVDEPAGPTATGDGATGGRVSHDVAGDDSVGDR